MLFTAARVVNALLQVHIQLSPFELMCVELLYRRHCMVRRAETHICHVVAGGTIDGRKIDALDVADFAYPLIDRLCVCWWVAA